MKTTSFFAALAIALSVASSSCNQADKHSSAEPTYSQGVGQLRSSDESDYAAKSEGTAFNANATSDEESMPSSSAASYAPEGMAFVRTADLKFRVKNVKKASEYVEALAIKFGGFTEYTHMASSQVYRNEVPMSRDSLLEITNYELSNQITIRVPNIMLDTVLRSMGQLVDFLDYRTITANNVTLQLKAARLARDRAARAQGKIQNAKDGNTIKGSNADNDNQMDADIAELTQDGLTSDIELSKVTLYIYQRPQAQKQMLANPEDISEYSPGFFAKMGESLKIGFEGLSAVFWFFLECWPLCLIVGAVVVFFVSRTKQQPAAPSGDSTTV